MRIMREFGGDDEAQEAYEKGFEHGYRKAMEESRGGYGERYDGGDYDGGDDGYGERRGVKGTGPYAGEYRRRRRY